MLPRKLEIVSYVCASQTSADVFVLYCSRVVRGYDMSGEGHIKNRYIVSYDIGVIHDSDSEHARQATHMRVHTKHIPIKL